jgi:hypothetical protein
MFVPSPAAPLGTPSSLAKMAAGGKVLAQKLNVADMFACWGGQHCAFIW